MKYYHIAMGLTFLAMILGWLGGGVLIFTMLYGLYVLIFRSVLIGLVFIGGAMVGGLVLNIVCSIIWWLQSKSMQAFVRDIEAREPS